MTILTPLPSPPSRSDPANFSARADAFLQALVLFQQELNAMAPTGSATELATSLNTASSVAGAALVAFLQGGASAVPRTLQAKVREVVSISDFGAAHTAADNTSAIQAALNAGRSVYVPAAPAPYVTRKLTAASPGQMIFGDGALSCLQLKAGETGELFNSSGNAVSLRHVRLFGGDDSGKASGAIAEATNGSATDRSGLFLDFDTDTQLTGVLVHGFGRYGIKPRNAAASRSAGFVISGSHVYNNWCGLYAGPDVAEYLRVTGSTFNGCQLGVVSASGNQAYAGCIISDNYTNVRVLGTSIANNGHSVFSACLINHATLYALDCIDVTVGMVFAGCQIFYGDIGLTRCQGIAIVDGVIDWRSMLFSGGGRNIIARNFFPQGDLSGALQNSIVPAVGGSQSMVDLFDNYNAAGDEVQRRRADALGIADFVAGDRVFAQWGETGVINSDGLRWTSNGGNGRFKLLSLNSGTQGTTPVVEIDRASGKVVAMTMALTGAANDAAAALAGVPVGGLYRNGSVVMQRVS